MTVFRPKLPFDGPETRLNDRFCLPDFEPDRCLAAEDGYHDAHFALLSVDLGDHAFHAGESTFFDFDQIFEFERDLNQSLALFFWRLSGGDFDDLLGFFDRQWIWIARICAKESCHAVNILNGVDDVII